MMETGPLQTQPGIYPSEPGMSSSSADFFERHQLERPEWQWCSTSEQPYLRRSLGPHEASWNFFTRTADSERATAGVNDMYVQISFRCQRSLLSEEKVIACWAEMRRRHILLASKVRCEEQDGNQSDRLYFTYHLPRSISEARELARKTSQFVLWETDSNQFRNTYLNGPRTLSDDCQAFLVISSPEPRVFKAPDLGTKFDYWLFVTHTIGDGMALHRLSNELFQLLETTSLKDEEILLPQEPYLAVPLMQRLPQAMEALLNTSGITGHMAWVAHRVLYECYQDKMTGTHSFSRQKSKVRSTRTVISTFDPTNTASILKKCREKQVTIADVTAALISYAYTRTMADLNRGCDVGLCRIETGSILLYSALNLRPILSRSSIEDDADYFHAAIGYYTLLLPCSFSSDFYEVRDFWQTARVARVQTAKASKSMFLIPRMLLTILDREKTARDYARNLKNDTNKTAENSKPSNSAPGVSGESSVNDTGSVAGKPEMRDFKAKPRPSTSLMGISMLGNLDRIYNHASLSAIQLQTLTTGSRQRCGAILLFTYTFAGSLCYSLGYDEYGFAEQEILRFWDELRGGVDRFLLSPSS